MSTFPAHPPTLQSQSPAESALLTKLIREVHTIKWILWWVMVIIPILAVGISVVVGVAVYHSLDNAITAHFDDN